MRLRLGAGVAAVHADRVELDDGTAIPTRTVVWAGGESGRRRWSRPAGLTPGHGGRIDVRPDLTVTGLPGVYAVGDVANIPPAGNGARCPSSARWPSRPARWAGREHPARDRRAEPDEPFHYKDKGIMAMIGRNAAVAEVGGHRHQVEGPLAFAAWLGVHAMLLQRRAQPRPTRSSSWAWDYFDRDHAAAVESARAPQRIAWGDDDADVPHIVARPHSCTAS